MLDMLNFYEHDKGEVSVAYVRHFRPAIAADAVASIYDDPAAAPRMMERNLGVELGAAAALRLR